MGLPDKIAFLGRPAAYPEGAASVERVETHMSWVFLTESRAYKLKKPARMPYLDYHSVEARRHACAEEVRLNRRLAADVYLGIVPLTCAGVSLALGGSGEIIDWLVVMRRLPADRMMAKAITDGRMKAVDATAVADLLAAFYASAQRASWSGPEYRNRLHADLTAAELELVRLGVDATLVGAVAAAQRIWLDRTAPVLEARVTAGRVVDAHGDLRPEHVCLETPPVIIDCLEFDPSLRLLDAASELSFLALECHRLGAAWVGELIIERYCGRSGDRPAAQLLALYRAQHACIRALVAARHVDDHLTGEAARWLRKAEDYLWLAARSQAGARD